MASNAQPLTLDGLVGEVLQDSYEILRKVGAGGMAWVFHARHVTTHQDVAIKILLPDLAVKHNLYERFHREAQIQLRLQHPGIVQAFEQVSAHGLVGISMTWAETSLARLLKSRELTLPEVAWLLPVLLDALYYAHHAGIVHRDLKPDNILMLVQQGKLVPQISDFGIAKLLNEAGLTRTGACMGTPQYMPPEQWVDSKHVDPRADVYSMGVLLYRLLVGQVPFQGTYSQLLWKIMNEEPEFPSHLDQRLSTLLRRCLAKNPEQRFGSCAALSSAWQETMQNMEVTPQELKAHPFVAQAGLDLSQQATHDTIPNRHINDARASAPTALHTPPAPHLGTVGYGETPVPSLAPTFEDSPQPFSRIDEALQRSLHAPNVSEETAFAQAPTQNASVASMPTLVASEQSPKENSLKRWLLIIVVGLLVMAGLYVARTWL